MQTGRAGIVDIPLRTQTGGALPPFTRYLFAKRLGGGGSSSSSSLAFALFNVPSAFTEASLRGFVEGEMGLDVAAVEIGKARVGKVTFASKSEAEAFTQLLASHSMVLGRVQGKEDEEDDAGHVVVHKGKKKEKAKRPTSKVRAGGEAQGFTLPVLPPPSRSVVDIWVDEYKQSRPDRWELGAEADSAVESLEREQEEDEERRTSQPLVDEDGFTLVPVKKRTAASVEAQQRRMEAAEARKAKKAKKQTSSAPFYRFEKRLREKKERDSLSESFKNDTKRARRIQDELRGGTAAVAVE